MTVIEALKKNLEEDPEVYEYFEKTLNDIDKKHIVNSANTTNLESILYYCDFRNKINNQLLRRVYQNSTNKYHFILKAAAPELAENEFFDFKFLNEYEEFKGAVRHSLQNVHLYTEPVESAFVTGRGVLLEHLSTDVLKSLEMRKKYLIVRQVFLENSVGYTLENSKTYDNIMRKAKYNRITYDNIVFLLMDEMLKTLTPDIIATKKSIIESNIDFMCNYYNDIVANIENFNRNSEQLKDLNRIINLSKAYIFMLPNNIINIYKSMNVNLNNEFTYLFEKNPRNWLKIIFKPNNAPRISCCINNEMQETVRASKTPMSPESIILFEKY